MEVGGHCWLHVRDPRAQRRSDLGTIPSYDTWCASWASLLAVVMNAYGSLVTRNVLLARAARAIRYSAFVADPSPLRFC